MTTRDREFKTKILTEKDSDCPNSIYIVNISTFFPWKKKSYSHDDFVLFMHKTTSTADGFKLYLIEIFGSRLGVIGLYLILELFQIFKIIIIFVYCWFCFLLWSLRSIRKSLISSYLQHINL